MIWRKDRDLTKKKRRKIMMVEEGKAQLEEEEVKQVNDK